MRKRKGMPSKVLGEPVFSGFDEKSQKIKTTLLFLSVIGALFALADLKIANDSSFLGLKFIGLEHNIFEVILLLTTIYFTLSFLWHSIDSFLEWRLRITGTRTAFVTTGKLATKQADYPDDPRQSTLYNWWKENNKSIEGLSERVKMIEDSIIKLEELLSVTEVASTEVNYDQKISREIREVRNNIASLDRKLSNRDEIIGNDRLILSLKRFDDWFKIFINSQNFRWLILDLLTPLILALSAIVLLSLKIIV